MFSNLPSTLQQQDFHDRHSDLIDAARKGDVAQYAAVKVDWAGCTVGNITRVQIPAGFRFEDRFARLKSGREIWNNWAKSLT